MEPVFDESYKITNGYVYPLSGEDRKKDILGDKDNKSCIYCGRNDGETTFKKVAHVIPAALGNKYVFNYNECDECNEILGRKENELVNFLAIERILIGARKRGSYPKHKPIIGGKTQLGRVPGTNTVYVNIDSLEDCYEFDVNEKEKKIVFTVKSPPPFNLADVCRSISHTGWALLSQEQRKKVEHLPEWLLGHNQLLPVYIDNTTITGNGFSSVVFEVWESVKENSDYPIIFRFVFGIRIITLYIPASPNITYSPEIFGGYHLISKGVRANLKRMKIEREERLYPTSITYSMSYEDIKKTEGDDGGL